MTEVMEADIAEWRGHIGRSETRRQVLDAASLRRFAVATGADPDVECVPPPLALWAWFLDAVPDAGLGRDGHPKRGGFMPPIHLPRRMFAATAFHFGAPLLLDTEAEIDVRIADVRHKNGRTGGLVFVDVDRIVTQAGAVRVTERQTIVYRDLGDGGSVPLPVPAGNAENPPAVGEVWRPGPVNLFRFSAATFNGHRIHYDQAYATGVEGYPALVVQGPFIAARLAMLAAIDGDLVNFEFRALSPLFADQPVRLLKSAPGAFQALRCDGAVAAGVEAGYR
jgi:3-methylfumaryl-CoA hydratase